MFFLSHIYNNIKSACTIFLLLYNILCKFSTNPLFLHHFFGLSYTSSSWINPISSHIPNLLNLVYLQKNGLSLLLSLASIDNEGIKINDTRSWTIDLLLLLQKKIPNRTNESPYTSG